MNKYSYDGVVKEFDTIISNRWRGSTYATSEKKARSNLLHRYQTEHGQSPDSKVTLPGKLITN